MTSTAASSSAEVPSLPEDPALVEAYEQALLRDEAAVVDEVAAFHERCKQRNVTALGGLGLPLRPFFLQRRQLESIARAVMTACEALRREALRLVDDVDALAEALPLPREFYRSIRMKEALLDPGFADSARPDGFLFPDRFVLSEPNFGNGWLISVAYTELMHDLVTSSGAWRAIGAPEAILPRPFLAFVDDVKLRLQSIVARGERRPRVALLAHREEHEIVLSWEERVIQLVYASERALGEQGIDCVLVHEDGLVVDEQGQARGGDGAPVDLVVALTIGTFFLFEPERLRPGNDLAHLAGSHVGNAPLLQPLASLCMDKGAMPLLQKLATLPIVDDNGFSVQLAESFYPGPEHARALRLEKDSFVLKRSFEGKHTHVGISTAGRPWNRVVDTASKTREYIAQRYVPLPRAVMPFLIDGKIERVPVRVEVSPLILRGRFVGAFCRTAPDGEGRIMSPPSDGMGLTIAAAV